MKSFYLLLVSVLLFISTGCAYQPGQPHPPTEWQVKCRVQPKAIYNIDPSDAVSQESLDKAFEVTNEIYAVIGLQFEFLPVIYEQNQNLYDIDNHLEYASIVAEQSAYYRDKKELLVHFVHSIPVFDAGGIANYPSNLFGFQFGIIIGDGIASPNEGYSSQVLAHELGHYLNLAHPWEDNLLDTFQLLREQGCLIQPCLVMNYCFIEPFTGDCVTKDKFTPLQRGMVQHWALSPARVDAMEVLKIPDSVVVMQEQPNLWPTTESTDPVID